MAIKGRDKLGNPTETNAKYSGMIFAWSSEGEEMIAWRDCHPRMTLP